MRMSLWLVFGLAATAMLTLFPETAAQMLRIEAFGWIFETRQGTFVIALFVLLLTLEIVRWIVRAILHGPSHAWRSLALSSRKREEKRLQQALADLINMRGDLGRKALRRKWRIIPGWMSPLLATLPVPANEQRLQDAEDSPLRIALAARIATDPEALRRPALAHRKALVQAWIKTFPDSPLARMRLAETLEEEGAWREAVDIWESLQREGHLSKEAATRRLLPVFRQLAASEPEKASLWLKKAHDRAPDDADLALRLGKAWLAEGQVKQAIRLWSQFVEEHGDMRIAAALLAQWQADALTHYKRLEKRRKRQANAAMLWLQAELAHAAGLSGMAETHLKALLERFGGVEGWRTLARWQMERGEYRQACESFAKMLEQ